MRSGKREIRCVIKNDWQKGRADILSGKLGRIGDAEEDQTQAELNYLTIEFHVALVSHISC